MTTDIFVALSMMGAGAFSMNVTLRASTFSDRSWWIRTTPCVVVSLSSISKAVPRFVLVIGATMANPVC